MNRRSFFAALAAPLVLDPERLLWRPGAKLISIPANGPISIPAKLLVSVGWSSGLLKRGDVFAVSDWPGRYLVTDDIGNTRFIPPYLGEEEYVIKPRQSPGAAVVAP